MDKINPPGLNELRYAVIEKLSNKVISLHKSKEDAEEFRNNSEHLEISDTVELANEVSYYQYW